MSFRILPYSDLFVRYLLGDERNKDLLLSFINAVNEHQGLPRIASVSIVNPFNLSEYQYDKEGVIDVKATDEKGRQYDIEVQAQGTTHFVHRSLYYWARLYGSQLSKGHTYGLLRPTVCINLLGFEMLAEQPLVHACFVLREKNCPELILTDHLVLHYLQLPCFEQQSDFSSAFERWMAFFKYAGSKEDVMRTILEDRAISKAHEAYTVFTADDRMRALYESRQKWLHDVATREEAAREEGMEKGLQKGREEGREEGRLEATRETREQTARKLLAAGQTPDFVAEITGLSLERIEELGRS